MNPEFEDTYRHKGLRKRLVEELSNKGIFQSSILEAIQHVPRHLFFGDPIFVEKAYEDIAFQIGEGQTISHPSTVAFQTQLLNPQRGQKILEIGSGSGYQTAILSYFGAKVFSIERQYNLYTRTKKLLQKMNVGARLFYGDGYKGLPAFAPFDRIIVTAGAPYIPEDLIDQLKPGGTMVIPVGSGEKQVMHVVLKNQQGETDFQVHGEFRFVPLKENKV